MYRGFQPTGAFRPPFGARAVSSREVARKFRDDWLSSKPQLRDMLFGFVNEEQWEGRGLHNTPITMLWFTGAGVHTSRDPFNHFTGRAFDANEHAVWLLDKKHGYYTNAIHFYPGGLPEGYDKDRFAYTPSNDSSLVAWCTAYKWDIKTGKKIQN